MAPLSIPKSIIRQPPTHSSREALDFLRPWESMDLLGVQGSGDCQSPAGRDLGQLLPLGSEVGNSSRAQAFPQVLSTLLQSLLH